MNQLLSRVPSRLALVALATATAFAAEPKILAGEPNLTSRTIHYHESDVVTVYVQYGMTTTFILPKPERIVAASCGDNKRFNVQTNGNLAFVTPGDEALGSKTNLNIVNQSGNIYSFYIVEDSRLSNAHADLKLMIEPSDQSLVDAINAPPRFVPADDVAKYRAAAEDAQAKAQAETARARREVEADRVKLVAQIPSLVKHDYEWHGPQKPFNLSTMWHTDTETVIEANPQEPGAVYELKDGKPALVDFVYKDGRYVLPKVVDQGYIQIGKSKLDFNRKG